MDSRYSGAIDDNPINAIFQTRARRGDTFMSDMKKKKRKKTRGKGRRERERERERESERIDCGALSLSRLILLHFGHPSRYSLDNAVYDPPPFAPHPPPPPSLSLSLVEALAPGLSASRGGERAGQSRPAINFFNFIAAPGSRPAGGESLCPGYSWG